MQKATWSKLKEVIDTTSTGTIWCRYHHDAGGKFRLIINHWHWGTLKWSLKQLKRQRASVYHQWISISLQVAALVPDSACCVFVLQKKIQLAKTAWLSSRISAAVLCGVNIIHSPIEQSGKALSFTCRVPTIFVAGRKVRAPRWAAGQHHKKTKKQFIN